MMYMYFLGFHRSHAAGMFIIFFMLAASLIVTGALIGVYDLKADPLGTIMGIGGPTT